MKRLTFMFIAGEPSGDALAAGLVRALKNFGAASLHRQTADLQPLTTSLQPEFIGGGGRQMAEAGVDLAVDMTRHSAVGLMDVARKLGDYRRAFDQLFRLATERLPDAIVLVDFSGFNHRFAHAIKTRVRRQQGTFGNWNPKIIQFVSPQVWASRPGRVKRMQRDLDLLLVLFPFEKEWHQKHAPALPVVFVGHPILDRWKDRPPGSAPRTAEGNRPLILLLPGSRNAELKRHLPPMLGAARRILATQPALFRMILPDQRLIDEARGLGAGQLDGLEISAGNLADSLQQAHLAIASTGTVTLECAYFGVPTVAIYRTSWATYQAARRLIRVPWLAMPNLLAGHVVYPEFLQNAATAENVAREAVALLEDSGRRDAIRAALRAIMDSLGGPGANQRAAAAVMKLLGA